ncbi:MAG TPA: phasin family protein, partial [Casimicrobiaceae bacterium]
MAAGGSNQLIGTAQHPDFGAKPRVCWPVGNGGPQGKSNRQTVTLKEPSMYNAQEQFAEFNKANVAQATKFAALSLENAEKLVKFNLSAAKAAIAQSVEGAQAVTSVKDVQDLLALRTKLAEAQVQTAVGYSRHLYELATEAQAGF